MKKSWLFAVIVLTCLTAMSWANMTVQMSDSTAGYYIAYVINTSDPIGIYQPGQSFATFCLEKNEYFTPGNTYDVTISEAAMYNGDPTKTNSDPLDDRTAYLYTKYMKGETTFDSDEYTSQQFQDAIHFIEGEITTSNALVDYATAAVATGGEWYNMGLGNVRVMNLWNLTGTPAQDQLVMIPVPGALLLGGLGISLVGLLRKKKAL